uniref:Calcineurin-like phosphoesterase n=1 Tax=Pithovirus LCPAC101 TaxID=2506586 RepID=A0A481Z2K9_9VIRU|nr:MAG: calcineurin-like phosphoesterase [Pithovirus LCPAC101]
MKFDLLSDLHLERGDVADYKSLLPLNSTHLIVAGDVARSTDWDRIVNFFGVACTNYSTVWYVLGNHEYYNNLYNNTLYYEDKVQKLKDMYKNLIFLNNDFQYLKHDDLVIYGGVMWSFSPDKKNFPSNLPIFKNNKNITHEHWNDMHQKFMDGLESAHEYAKSHKCKLMVISHYSPVVNESLDSKYHNYNNNFLYCTDLSKYFSDSVVAWVFGHTGFNCDLNKNGTRVVSNQYRIKSGPKYNKNMYITV